MRRQKCFTNMWLHTAAKQLASLRARRAEYLNAWREYVHKLGESLEGQLQEKSDIIAGFDAEEAALQDTIETAKATVLSIAGREANSFGDPTAEMDVSAPEATTEDRQKLQRQEEALLKAVNLMREDADKEVARVRDGFRTPRRHGHGDAQSISSEEDGKKPHGPFLPFGGAHT